MGTRYCLVLVALGILVSYVILSLRIWTLNGNARSERLVLSDKLSSSRQQGSLHHERYAKRPTGIIVLKLPRTGSTWFTEQLNSLNRVFVSKEIVQHKDLPISEPKQLEAHLRRALTIPQQKFSSSTSWIPFIDGRFMQDYILRLKMFQQLQFVGFTINLEHVSTVNWARILGGDNTTAKVILLLRSNIIKTAISSYRGQLSSKVCGHANSKHNDESCRLPKMVNWTSYDFKLEINKWTMRKDSFIKAYLGDPSLSALGRAVVYYEQMQMDLLKTFKDLFDSLGSYDIDSKVLLTPSTWEKRTGETLSQILLHYHEILHLLVKDVKCTCLVRQLQSTQPELFDDITRCRVLIADDYTCVPLPATRNQIW